MTTIAQTPIDATPRSLPLAVTIQALSRYPWLAKHVISDPQGASPDQKIVVGRWYEAVKYGNKRYVKLGKVRKHHIDLITQGLEWLEAEHRAIRSYYAEVLASPKGRNLSPLGRMTFEAICATGATSGTVSLRFGGRDVLLSHRMIIAAIWTRHQIEVNLPAVNQAVHTLVALGLITIKRQGTPYASRGRIGRARPTVYRLPIPDHVVRDILINPISPYGDGISEDDSTLTIRAGSSESDSRYNEPGHLVSWSHRELDDLARYQDYLADWHFRNRGKRISEVPRVFLMWEEEWRKPESWGILGNPKVKLSPAVLARYGETTN